MQNSPGMGPVVEGDRDRATHAAGASEVDAAGVPPPASNDDPQAAAKAPPSLPAATPSRGSPPDFRAIDLATRKAVAPDESAVKEQRTLFKLAVHGEMKWLVVWALRIGALILASMLIVRFWHLAAPASWRWLTDPELQAMDKMLFSSAFGGFVLTYLKDAIAAK